jgi:hypothetical protein
MLFPEIFCVKDFNFIFFKDYSMDFDLDPTERDIFDEINVMQDEPIPRASKPPPSRQFRKKPSVSFNDDEDPIDMFANDSKMNNPEPAPPMEWDGGNPGDSDDFVRQQQRSIPTGPSDGYKSIEDEKADLLNRIARLQKKGLQTSNRLTIYSDIEDIRSEYKRLTYSIEVEQSIKFQRRMLIACVSGVEFLNKKFDPFDLELDGWSENIMENQEDYDTVFEELFQKYRSKVNVAPEIKLMFMIGGSAMMFHLSKSMFKPFTQQAASQQNKDFTFTNNNQQIPGQKRDMKGPGIDIGSLGGGFDISSLLGTLNQQAIQQTQQDDEISDIISVGSEVRDLELAPGTKRKKRSRRDGKKELVL